MQTNGFKHASFIQHLQKNLRVKNVVVGVQLKGNFTKRAAAINPDAADGGRHPLPGVESFSKVLQQLGISRESHVVVYDDKNGAHAAARFWWMMKAAGHSKIQVVDGGYEAALAAGCDLVLPRSALVNVLPKLLGGSP